ncbi:hypothetical protein AGABI2DRAFT_140389 [Agaricus bisporus var. bisporus H97]|uniref:hypothetical protein n=1 Tax=Agaricus bisporus var. bisporus (strain H97 / ATCC MYA-4626 / FGSC 10389) TaxID=936046 RepID=UPI00029F7FEA|nr:hypothetical protein AGABI2DRAFT_140389 [Agaricus bisporus var. bisporus H97]EKV51418.1 hypothetical protein AGABI2DRAFT_140389 [Agaricus bisporus var. bisporus H97]
MSFSKLVLLFVAFVASAGALSSPHPRGIHHRALAGRITVPESPVSPPLPVRRRQNSKRCKSRPSSAALIVSTKDAEATHTREATHTKEATPTKEVVPTKEAPTTKETEAPKPTTHETTHKASPTPKPAPPPTTKEEAPAPTKKPPPPPPTSNLPSFLTGLNTGDATFYATGLGACGIVNKDTDFIAAASKDLFDAFPGYNGANPNKNPMCNRRVSATYCLRFIR